MILPSNNDLKWYNYYKNLIKDSNINKIDDNKEIIKVPELIIYDINTTEKYYTWSLLIKKLYNQMDHILLDQNIILNYTKSTISKQDNIKQVKKSNSLINVVNYMKNFIIMNEISNENNTLHSIKQQDIQIKN